MRTGTSIAVVLAVALGLGTGAVVGSGAGSDLGSAAVTAQCKAAKSAVAQARLVRTKAQRGLRKAHTPAAKRRARARVTKAQKGLSRALARQRRACATHTTPTNTGSSTTQVTHTFAVSLAGSGSGSVISSPAGIQCPGTCQAGFDGGTQVTLTATPASGSQFAGWSGGGCSSTNSCQVTLSSDLSVTATFTQSAIVPEAGRWTAQTVAAGSSGNTMTVTGVWFTVGPDRTAVSKFNFVYSYRGMGQTLPCSGTDFGVETASAPITNGQFSTPSDATWSGRGWATFEGTFDSASSAHGTARYHGYIGSFECAYSGQVDTDIAPWTASPG